MSRAPKTPPPEVKVGVQMRRATTAATIEEAAAVCPKALLIVPSGESFGTGGLKLDASNGYEFTVFTSDVLTADLEVTVAGPMLAEPYTVTILATGSYGRASVRVIFDSSESGEIVASAEGYIDGVAEVDVDLTVVIPGWGGVWDHTGTSCAFISGDDREIASTTVSANLTHTSARGTVGHAIGKHYLEIEDISFGTGPNMVILGFGLATATLAHYPGYYDGVSFKSIGLARNGDVWGLTSVLDGSWTTFTTGDIIGFLFDFDTNRITVYKNGVYRCTLSWLIGTSTLIYPMAGLLAPSAIDGGGPGVGEVRSRFATGQQAYTP